MNGRDGKPVAAISRLYGELRRIEANMELAVVTPPKLYLDTSHLINIAKVRRGEVLPGAKKDFTAAYAQIADCIHNRHFGLVFNPASALEWVDGNATLQSAMEIAEVVDTAKLQYEIEVDSFVYLNEVLDELRRLAPELNLPVFDSLHVRDEDSSPPRALGVLARSVPTFFEEKDLTCQPQRITSNVPFSSASDHARAAWKFKESRQQTFVERVSGFMFAYSRDKELMDGRSNTRFDERDFQQWIRRFLRVDRILKALNPNVDEDKLLSQVKIGKCPSVNVFFNTWNHRLRSSHTPQDNDVDDWMYLPAIVYADAVLSERQLAHFVRSANPILSDKITHDPVTFAERLAKWQSD